jgi:3',5'-cyclic AMP phosphodiesterase CpdA
MKRMLGMVNWYRRRSRQHLAATLSAIVADMQSEAPDHIVVTGDLVNLGLPLEHEAARHWLAALGPPSRVTAIPGNHDIYVDMASNLGVGRWQAFMSDDEPSASQEPFPFVRRLGCVALIGLNSAVPTPLFHAYGRLGPGQLERLGHILARLGAQKLVRVVLIHHPPLPGQASVRSALQDAEDLALILARHGAELVLHGHNHRAMTVFAPGATRPIPVIGVPSASLGLTHGSQTLARYNLYRITPDPEAAIELVERGMKVPGGEVVEIRRLQLGAADPAVA